MRSMGDPSKLWVLVVCLVGASLADICTQIPGLDCVGNDVHNETQITNPEACCALCKTYGATCTVWKWDPSGTCYLKNGCANPYACPNCVVGKAGPPASVFSCSTEVLGAHVSLAVTAMSYTVSVGDSLWFPLGDTIVHIQKSWYSAMAGSLTPSGSANTTGSDALGKFVGFQQMWLAGSVRVTTHFKCYTAGMIAFDLWYPDGAKSVNGSHVSSDDVSCCGDVVTQFPSFAGGGWWGEEAGNLRHGGIWTLWEWWSVGMNHLPNGAQHGPVYIFNTSFAPGQSHSPAKPTTAILSPLDHFHTTQGGTFQNRGGGGVGLRTAYGVAATVIDMPANFTTSVGLLVGTGGITNTTYAWGALMRQLYGTTRLVGSASLRTALTEKVSYWTDNGAVYFQSWWDRACPRPATNCTLANSPQELLRQLKRSFNGTLPFGIYQLDTWWFYQGEDFQTGKGLDCIDWRPRADMWPSGLPAVTQSEGGIPLLLYSWGYTTPANGNRMLNFTWETSLNINDPSPREAQPVLAQTYAFYSMIRDRFLAFNGTSFEADNMDLMTSHYASHITAADGCEQWWQGFAAPFCEAGIPVQICESSAADILESLRYGCVTNSRDNIDDVPGQRGDINFVNRWHVGFDRMFLAALAIQPFFDNVWSMPTQPGSTWAPAREEYVELAWLLSVLSAGPAGVGDLIGNTNASLVMTCCAADGRLLKASTPATYLDLVYLPPTLCPISNVDRGRVFAAVSYVPIAAAANEPAAGSLDAPTAAPYYSLLTVDVGNALTIFPEYLTPDASASAIAWRQTTGPSPLTSSPGSHGMSDEAPYVLGYVAVPWGAFDSVAAACANGSPGAACVTPFSDSQPYEVNTGVAASKLSHNFDYTTLSPVWACASYPSAYPGYAVLGELQKIVRVSVVRFTFIDIDCAGGNVPVLTLQLAGAPGEMVAVTVLAPTRVGASPSGTVWTTSVRVGPSGVGALLCGGDGSQGNPCRGS